MFWKKRESDMESDLSEVASSSAPKYPKPKILLVDIRDDSEAVLKEAGHNVCSGSFGVPYRVEKSDGFTPVIVECHLPNYAEQEIVVIDLVPAPIADQTPGEKRVSPGADDWWASCSLGVIDPRPLAMFFFQKWFGRILSHGGVFVIFADYRVVRETVWGHLKWSRLVRRETRNWDDWCFLSALNQSNVGIARDKGQEITVVDSLFGQLLVEHSKEVHYLCTFEPRFARTFNFWMTLAHNKYGSPVAGAVVHREEEGQPDGLVLLLPQLRNKAGFLRKLLADVLPDVAPHLFPHVEGLRWVHRPEYELPSVVGLKAEIDRVHEEAEKQVAALEQHIEKERLQMGFMYALLRATGDELVEAVKTALEVVGFQRVVKMDPEVEKDMTVGRRREDLQIRDESHLVLVEVTGMSGLPREAKALQVWKYIAPRMRELDRIDVRGLAIVNHQKHLPALDRNNESLFSKDVLTNAQEHKFGLMTSWDLWRLVRSFRKNSWNHDQIRDLFYRDGRILPVPAHYEPVGKIEHFWEKAGAVGVRIEEAELRRGDRIAFELPVEFEEETIESLQIDGQPVARAGAGDPVGIQTHLSKEQARKGTRVFRVVSRPSLSVS